MYLKKRNLEEKYIFQLRENRINLKILLFLKFTLDTWLISKANAKYSILSKCSSFASVTTTTQPTLSADVN